MWTYGLLLGPREAVCPTFFDVEMAVANEEAEDCVGFVIVIKSAHKTIRLREAEWPLMFFEFQQVLYHYVVCHVGGRWSGKSWCVTAT